MNHRIPLINFLLGFSSGTLKASIYHTIHANLSSGFFSYQALLQSLGNLKHDREGNVFSFHSITFNKISFDIFAFCLINVLVWFKDVRANCFYASLLLKQIHMPRHASSVCAKYSTEMNNNRADGHCYSFAWT